MADSFAEFGHKLKKLEDRLTGGDLRVVTERVAQKAKPVAAAAVSPNTLSHWGRGAKRGGAKVAARYDIISDSQSALYPTVPPLAALLEKGSGTTWKAPKRRGSKRRKKGTVGSYTRARVPARHAWTKAVAVVRPRVPKWVDDEVQRILRDLF